MAFPLIAEFNINFTQVSLLTGYNLCAVGAVGVFVSALARKFGKRPPMLGSMALALAGTIWGGAAQSYGSLVGARIIQGFGIAMFESVAFAIIGDLYHVHQRGSRMALYILAQSGVAHLPSLVAGKISVDLGWRWVFWLLAIFLGIGLLLTVFFGWESAFNRNAVYDIDTSSQNVGTLLLKHALATDKNDRISK
jgi:MFS family permease